MAVQFKFRSSATFDSVDLQGRTSISVRDLKSKILLHKHLTLCQDFDLVFSNSVTGQEFHDANVQIPSGSSVIVKRVPAGSTPSVTQHFDVAENFQTKDAYQVNSSLPTVAVQEKNVEVDDFDDFGIDLCPVPETAVFDLNLDIDEGICLSRKKGNIEVPRCSDQPMVECQKLELSDLSDAISRGPVHGMEGRTLHTKSKLKIDEEITSEKGVKANPPAIQTVNLPSELKCSLCNSFFQNAVMIPCCQHSFCEQCIRRKLIEEARCPKCFSTKCRVQDLLPNISLRQAIEHFLESQILVNGSDNGLHRYAPDGESGIQAKEVSCAASVFQPEMLHSSSATGWGSNQIMEESAYDSLCKNNASVSHIKHSGSDKCLKPVHLSRNTKQLDGGRHCSTHPAVFKSELEGLGDFGDFQGENQPMQEEGVGTSLMETGRHRKGNRACYMCGSLDHLIRDCPVASSPHPMLQTSLGNSMYSRAMPGFTPPYWNGSSMVHVPPFPNLHSNPGMMLFNAAMIPPATFAIPTFMPSMYGGLPTFGRCTRAEGVATPGRAKVGGRVSHPEFLDLQRCEKEWKLSSENRKREQYFDYEDEDDDGYSKRSRHIEAERSSDRRSHVDREKSLSYSNNSSPRVSWRKHHRDVHLDDGIPSADERHEKISRSSIAVRDQKPYYRPERSSSDVEDIPSSSVCHSEEKYKNRHRTFKRHNERKEQHDNDSGRSRHQSDREKDFKRKRVGSDIQRQNQKHHSRSESGLEPSSSDPLKRRKKKESSHSSKHSKHDVKSINNEVSHDRWQMITDSVVDDENDYRYYKQRRVG